MVSPLTDQTIHLITTDNITAKVKRQNKINYTKQGTEGKIDFDCYLKNEKSTWLYSSGIQIFMDCITFEFKVQTLLVSNTR